MTKNIFKIAAMAALVAGGINMANAASSTTVTVKGSVNTVTCDVNAQASTIDLGNRLPGDFTSPGVLPTTAGATQPITLTVTGCSGTAGAQNQASLVLSGPVLPAGNTYFNDDAAGKIGVGVAMSSAPTTLLPAGYNIPVGAKGDADTDLNNKQIELVAGLISTMGNNTASGLSVQAPLTFTFAYN
ncbi:type 1 fimbrial protein [Serratia marcescens]|nr:type 1 fimbrial protein [Serratia marcescens]MBH3063773.1 type 1 fimbrial protein [Serratia marcescens]